MNLFLTPLDKKKIDRNKELKNCWEFQNCPKEKRQNCPAFQTDSGKECWLVATKYCPKIGREFNYCWDCPWFKKLYPDFKIEKQIKF